MESLLFPIIMLAVTLAGGGILLLLLKTSENARRQTRAVRPCRLRSSLLM